VVAFRLLLFNQYCICVVLQGCGDGIQDAKQYAEEGVCRHPGEYEGTVPNSAKLEASI